LQDNYRSTAKILQAANAVIERNSERLPKELRAVKGDGEKILRRIEQRARAKGLKSIFVLTTRTMHWFLKRGFVQAPIDWLPEARQRKYNLDRKSVVLVKKVT
jgi:N-acetylglutamate synthase-like GNAT family acetyltransferase